MVIQGTCHCGNISYQLDWPADTPVVPRACGCTFCQKHGAEWTAHPRASLHLRIADANRVSRHRFGTETADFYVCSQCGVVAVCTSDIDGHLYAVVNTRAFADRDVLAAPVGVAFDGEDVDARLERRTRNWIGRVVIDMA